jgi:hypothetical protein
MNGNALPGAGPRPPAATSSSEEIAAFVEKARQPARPASGTGRGGLIFALDATMSRQPTWDRACTLQAGMFGEAAGLGGLSVQLVYYRGFGECKASRWVKDGEGLSGLMTRIDCRGGRTQLGRVLAHARAEAGRARVAALVFVGDAMEEPADPLCATAGELGLLGVPVFLFQEGYDPAAERAFREIARLSRGAWCRFDEGSAAELGALLRAAAAYAAGGRAALEALAQRPDGAGAALLLGRMG